MRNQEDFNFLSYQSSENINNFRKIVTECVLATDLAKNMTWLAAAKISLSTTGSKGDNSTGVSTTTTVVPLIKRQSSLKRQVSGLNSGINLFYQLFLPKLFLLVIIIIIIFIILITIIIIIIITWVTIFG